MTITDRLKKVFNDEGNFNLKNYDPYRIGDSKEVLSFHEILFTEDGDLVDGLQSAIETMVKEKNLSPFCDAVKCYYAEEHGGSTKGSYPAIYMWR